MAKLIVEGLEHLWDEQLPLSIKFGTYFEPAVDELTGIGLLLISRLLVSDRTMAGSAFMETYSVEVALQLATFAAGDGL